MPLSIDSIGEVIRITSKGFLSEEEVTEHFRALAQRIATRRRSTGTVGIVVDLLQSVPQSQGVAAIIAKCSNETYVEADRVAVLLSSALLRLQTARVHKDRGIGYFSDPEEAFAFAQGVTPADPAG